MAKVLVTDTYLEDIADAIRDKTSGSDTYTPSQMANAISNLTTKIVLPSEGISFGYSTNSTALANILANIDTSQVVRFDDFFISCTGNSFTEGIPIDTSKGVYFYSMYNHCVNMITVPEMDTSKGTDFRYMFYTCSRLTTIPVLDLSNATELISMFDRCPSLSNESLNNILYMLANATSYTGTKTLAYVGISESQATTCTGLSNYDDFVSAGWSTGY